MFMFIPSAVYDLFGNPSIQRQIFKSCNDVKQNLSQENHFLDSEMKLGGQCYFSLALFLCCLGEGS